MQRQGSRPGALDSLRSPHPAQSRPIIHRSRHRPEWVEDTRLRGKEYWKAIGLATAFTVVMFMIWYYGGK